MLTVAPLYFLHPLTLTQLLCLAPQTSPLENPQHQSGFGCVGIWACGHPEGVGLQPQCTKMHYLGWHLKTVTRTSEQDVEMFWVENKVTMNKSYRILFTKSQALLSFNEQKNFFKPKLNAHN